MTGDVKPFPPMMPGDSMPVTAEEAKRINDHCENMHAEIKRLRHALGRVLLFDPKGFLACVPAEEALGKLIARVEEVTTENNHLILDALHADAQP